MEKSEIYLAALAKAKVAFNATSDRELAFKINIDPSAICLAKKNGTAPVRHIIEACIEKNVSIDYIFGITPKPSV